MFPFFLQKRGQSDSDTYSAPYHHRLGRVHHVYLINTRSRDSTADYHHGISTVLPRLQLTLQRETRRNVTHESVLV